MPSRIHIHSDFPNAWQQSLLKDVCRSRDRHDVHVSNFSRFGKSHASLLLLYFGRKPAGLPFLLKVAKYRKIEYEFKATKILEDDVREANLIEDRIFSARDTAGRKWGALLFARQGTDSPSEVQNPTALRDLIYRQTPSNAKLELVLRRVYKKLGNAHSKCKSTKVRLRIHFDRYFRNDIAGPRIRCILGPDANKERMEFLGAKIVNPLKFLRALPEQVTVHPAYVHGDLHPDNIIVDSEWIPHLIDFAWAHKRRDVLVDFVLLENSIRFMAFPRPINLRDQLEAIS